MCGRNPPHITLVYAWTITSGVTGKSGKQRKRKAASGLGALLAALRHHHGPDDTAQLEVGTDYQEWRRVDSGSGTAEERLTAIEYLEKRLGVASGGSWNDALALQEGAKQPADGPPAGRPGKAPCRGEAQGSGQGKAPAASSRVSCTCRRTRPQSLPLALLRLLSSACSPPPARPQSQAMANPGELFSACSPPPALLRLLSSTCTAPVSGDGEPWGALFRLLSSACSPLRERRQLAGRAGGGKPSGHATYLLSSACSPPPALLLSSTYSPPPALLLLLSSACSPPPALQPFRYVLGTPALTRARASTSPLTAAPGAGKEGMRASKGAFWTIGDGLKAAPSRVQKYTQHTDAGTCAPNFLPSIPTTDMIPDLP